MRIATRLLTLGAFILLGTLSCSQVITETVSPVTATPAGGQYTRVAILPFADYTQASSPYDYWRRNALVLEALQDEFYREGFIPAVEEDVVRFLINEGVIISAKEFRKDTYFLDQEQEGDWSDEMKEELRELAFQTIEENRENRQYGRDETLVALDTPMIRKIGREFSADYIIRGRVIVYRSSEEDTFNPIKTGIVSFLFKAGQRFTFGVADSELYEFLGKAAGGAATAGIIAHNATRAATPVHTGAWAAAGAGVALLAQKGGNVPDATVQVRVIVQDAATGSVLWLNRAESRVTPVSTFAEHDRNILFAKAIDHTARSLVNSFADDLAAGRVPAVKGASSLEAMEKEKEAYDTAQAAEEAKKAAYKAKLSAKDAEVSAIQAKEAEEDARKSSKKSERIFEKSTIKK